MTEPGSRTPLSFDIDMIRHTMRVNGVEISLEVLATIAKPDARVLYRFRRELDGRVIVQRLAEDCVIWVDEQVRRDWEKGVGA